MSKTVLIIEDDNFLQGLEAKKMEKEGYEVITASNAEEAYAYLDRKLPVHIILLDLMLPGIDGFEILEKVRNTADISETPVIVFSNLSEEKDIEQATALGISEFMVKSNFTLDQLASRVKEIIGR